MAAHAPDPAREGTDDDDLGWGEPPEPGGGQGSDDWYRRERPPHHDQ